MKSHPGLIANALQVAQLAERLKNEPVIAIDTEFIRESSFYPMVEIIQIATGDESWLVDAQAFKRGYKPGPQGLFDPGLQPLLDIFQDKKILKVVHAAQGDQECLYMSFGIVASPILDTAVAASLCGYGDAVGLAKLLQSVLGVMIKKGHARTNWSVRPLPPHLEEYAHADVTHLVKLSEALIQQLEGLGRKDWAFSLSAKWEDPSLYELDVEGIAQKLARGGKLDQKGYSALLELVRWREERVRHLNLPRRWVADDAVLVDIAHVRPKDLDHLSSFRGLNKGELKNSGPTILAALERAAARVEPLEVPRSQRPAVPTPEESQVLDLIKCYLGILADEHQIAARHLLLSAQLLPLLRQKLEGPQDLVKAGVLSFEAATLIGDEILALLRGKRALSIQDGKIKTISL